VCADVTADDGTALPPAPIIRRRLLVALSLCAVFAAMLWTSYWLVLRWADDPDRPVTPAEELRAVADDLRRATAAQRLTRRYLSLRHLDLPERRVWRETLAEVRDALLAAGYAVELQPLPGTGGSCHRLDLASLGWTLQDDWPVLARTYPGLVVVPYPDEPSLAELRQQIEKLGGTGPAAAAGRLVRLLSAHPAGASQTRRPQNLLADPSARPGRGVPPSSANAGRLGR
jgi:hypothetical protein